MHDVKLAKVLASHSFAHYHSIASSGQCLFTCLNKIVTYPLILKSNPPQQQQKQKKTIRIPAILVQALQLFKYHDIHH